MNWTARWPLGLATLALIAVAIASFWWMLEVDRRGSWQSCLEPAVVRVSFEPFPFTSQMWDNHLWSIGRYRVVLYSWHDRSLFKPSVKWRPHIGWHKGFYTPTSRYLSLTIPLYLPILLTLIPTTLAWRTHILSKRRGRASLCLACAYPLTGLPLTAPCPECGRPRTNPAIGL